jgi:hypothetical protein
MYTYGSHVFGSVNFSGVEGRKENEALRDRLVVKTVGA